MEEPISQQASSRYIKVLEGYKARLKSNPNLKLSEYCRESHTNYSGAIDWAKRHGISILELRRDVSQRETPVKSSPDSGNAFIQFTPSVRSLSGNLLGISITFSDGVNLTLQECSVESLISLLTIYRSRQGGVPACSD